MLEATAGIDPRSGRIELYDGHNNFSLLHELIHYEQLVNRGLLGKPVAEIGQQVVANMEFEAQRILQNMGLAYEGSVSAK